MRLKYRDLFSQKSLSVKNRDEKFLTNKKGDVTISTVILIVLGLAVLVLLIIGFTKGWDFFFGIFDSGPSDLQTVAKACIGYVEASLSIDFCKYRLVEIDGKDELVNCNDGRILQSLNTDGVNVPNSLKTCLNDAQDKQRACEDISESKRSNVRINGGETCSVVGGIVVSPETLTFTEVANNKFNPASLTFTVKLSAEPSAPVTVTVSDPSRVAVSINVIPPVATRTLTFNSTNWQEPQEVTVTPDDDNDVRENTVTVDLVGIGFGRESVTVILKEP